MRIAAVVLAAGEGRRMGGPKALLRLGETTFLAHVCGLFLRPGVAEVLAVVAEERVAAGLPDTVRAVKNPRPGEAMLSSVVCGLDAAGEADAVLLHPVDHPLVAAATIDRVVAALEGGAVIAVPSHENRRGHPGGFARTSWTALRAASPGRGARAVLADHPEWVVHVPGDPGCVTGIDTPEDYERWIAPR